MTCVKLGAGVFGQVRKARFVCANDYGMLARGLAEEND